MNQLRIQGRDRCARNSFQHLPLRYASRLTWIEYSLCVCCDKQPALAILRFIRLLWAGYVSHDQKTLKTPHLSLFMITGYEAYRQLIKGTLSHSSPIEALSNLTLHAVRTCIPVYLCTCGWILFISIFLTSPSQFIPLIGEAREAVAFISNFRLDYHNDADDSYDVRHLIEVSD